MSHPTPNPKKFKDIKAVIFDWSGVISDDRRPVHAADGIVLEKYGIKNVSFDEWLIDTKASAPEYFSYRGVVGDPSVLLAEYERGLTQVRSEGIHPILYPDAIATLQFLQNSQRKLAVISKHPESHLHREAREYDIESYFEEITGGVPEKSVGISRVMNDLQLFPEMVAYVGDMIYDVEAAKRAGVVAVAVATGYQSHEVLAQSQPDILLSSLSELTHFL